ncbi:helix-turn-helix transcriptional regulator [Bordetella genomosp. 9]|uniref:Helix-turn-helix transcriptional regulator n=1 Tax=Bordetella genomosp. 9 TaxID=1416803 RepID=A0A1W6Z274_9BORD|nr:response regulator transcription factor [Bordetella genomosp. 9]ARP87430.1 helix-turn-helix transcriptional regulator [Bordetella genomosp. 9]ARP91411.1 helix-turn-helix transcriptional regulator [Bordetella genomosp. 9]
MTTVLIEEYAILRIAIQHILETARSPESVMAMAPQKLNEMSLSLARPVELLVLGITGMTDNDLHMLSTSMSLLQPRHTLVLHDALDPRFLMESARGGVCGLLPKSSTPEAITAAVHLVLAGGQCFPRTIVEATQSAPHMPGRGHAAIRMLTPRQEEILRLLAKGRTMREISREIGISVATVKSHARTLYWKLNARNQAEAAYIAVQEGLLKDERGEEPPG